MNRRGATGLVAGANAAALGIQFLTTVLIARKFGTGAEMDAYTVAVAIPESLQYLLMLATLSVLFTPMWMEARARAGEGEAWSMALSLLAALALGVAALLPVLYVTMPGIMVALAPGLDATSRALAVELGDLILPGLLYYATAGILLGLCYAHYDFRVAAANTVLLAGLNLLGFAVFVEWGGGGARGLMLGRLAALGGAQVFLLWGALRHARGIRWKFQLAHPELRTLLKYMPPYVFGAVSGQLALLINRAFVSTLGTGSVAAWGYGQRLADIPLAVLGAAFGTTFLPDFAGQTAAQETRAANATWDRAVVRVFLWLTPIAALTMTLATPLIAVLFERGSFDAVSTQTSALVLVGLAAALPLRATAGLVVRAMPAFKTRVLPLALSALSTGANVALDFLLIGALGLFGIALAASIGDGLFAVAGALAFWRRMGARPRETLATVGKILLAGLACGAASALTRDALGGFPAWAQLAVSGSAGAMLFVLIAAGWNLGETRAVWSALWARAVRG
jgi:putative peptidoglycan lipid II flippase